MSNGAQYQIISSVISIAKIDYLTAKKKSTCSKIFKQQVIKKPWRHGIRSKLVINIVSLYVFEWTFKTVQE